MLLSSDMKSLKEQFIAELIGEAAGRAGPTRAARVMDLGCGTAAYMPAIFSSSGTFFSQPMAMM